MIPVDVISLLRSPERRKAFSHDNAHLTYRFFDAVDGKELPNATRFDPALFGSDLPYTDGAYGVAMSHLTLWQRAQSLNSVLTVAEDDAIFRGDFEEQQQRLISGLPTDWDIVLWGWNFDHFISLKFMEGVSPANVTCDQDQMRSAVGTFQALRDEPQLLQLAMCWGIPAYTISPAGASRLQTACFPLEKFDTSIPITGKVSPNNGIDIAMNRAYATLRAYVSFPPLVVTRNEHASSTIQTQKPAGWVSRRLAECKRLLSNQR